MWTPHSVESIWQDVAYAIRSLRHQRGFTVTVVTVLALVIGLNTTLFTVLTARHVNAVRTDVLSNTAGFPFRYIRLTDRIE